MNPLLQLSLLLSCGVWFAGCTNDTAPKPESTQRKDSNVLPVLQTATNAAAPVKPSQFNPWHYVPHQLGVQISTVSSYGSGIGEVKAKAARLGIGSSDFFSLSLPACSLRSAMLSYSQARQSLGDQCTNFYDRTIGDFNLQLDTTKVARPTGEMRAGEFRTYVERVFASNGLTIVQLSADETALIRTRNLQIFTNNAPFKGELPIPPLPPSNSR